MGSGKVFVLQPVFVQTGTATGEQGRDLPKAVKGKLLCGGREGGVSNWFRSEVHQLGKTILGNT